MKTRKLYFASTVLLAGSIFFAIGCQDKAEKEELDKFKAAAQIQEQNKQVVREVINCIDSGDFNKLGSLLSDDFSLLVPGLLQTLKKDQLFQARNRHFAAFPDWVHKIEILIAEGDKVAIKLTQYGTHKAQYKGIEPTGKYVTNPAIHIMTIVNGKVKDWYGIEDNLGLMTQLGMELKPTDNKK